MNATKTLKELEVYIDRLEGIKDYIQWNLDYWNDKILEAEEKKDWESYGSYMARKLEDESILRHLDFRFGEEDD